jgi:beta-galactosidase
VIDYPILLVAKVVIEKTGDMYLNMEKYGKGYLWVNGRNLGRYWIAGPQKRLFCPGCWLR